MELTRIFVSYSHDHDAHVAEVSALATQLMEWGGLDVILDLWESHPAQGWTAWMEGEIKRADFVLMVCSQGYHDKLNGQTAPSHGKGVKWEGRIIRTLLYQAGTVSAKLVPVLLSNGQEAFIPTVLGDSTFYKAHTEAGFEALYRYLTGQPKHLKPKPKQTRREMPSLSAGPIKTLPANPTSPTTGTEDSRLSDAIRGQLKQMIGQGRTMQALQILGQQDLADPNAIITLQSRLRKLHQDEIVGILSHDVANQRRNQITVDFLNLLDLI